MITTIWELIRNRFFAVLNNSLRCRRLFLAYCLGCCLGFCGYWFSRYSPGFTFGGPGDFTTFYTGALIVRSGQPEHLYDLVTQAHFQKQLLLPYGWVFKDGLLPYMYPPFLAILVIPFTYLPLQLAFHAWNLLSILILFLSIKMLCMHLAPRIPGRFAFCIVGALAFFPVFETLYKGQASFFILLFFTMIYIQMDSGREKLAGVALGLALLKPQLVLTITLLALLQKRWRMLISFSVTAVILLVCSLILVKSEGIHAYWNLSGAAMRWNGPFNFVPALMPNIRGTIYRLDFLLSAFDVSRASTQFLMIVTGALTVLSFILFIFLFRIPRRTNDAAFDLQFVSILIMTLLLTPYIYRHDLSLLIAAGFILFAALKKLKKPRCCGLVLAIGHFAILVPLLMADNETSAQIVALFLFAALFYTRHLLNKSIITSDSRNIVAVDTRSLSKN